MEANFLLVVAGGSVFTLCYSWNQPRQMYDIPLKELFQSFGTSLTERLAGAAPVEWLNVELSETRAQRVDFVCRLANGAIFHMEFQTTNEPNMAHRMLDYYVALLKKYGSAPRQVLLYLGNDPQSMPDSLKLESLQFRYSIVDLGNLDAEELWKSAYTGDVILSILCHQPDPKIRLDRILQRIRALEPEQAVRATRLLLLLSYKRGLSDIVIEGVKDMPATIQVDDDKRLRRQYDAGRSEGKIDLLRVQLGQKFGPLSPSIEQKLQTATQSEIEVWGTRILFATSIDGVLN